MPDSSKELIKIRLQLSELSRLQTDRPQTKKLRKKVAVLPTVLSCVAVVCLSCYCTFICHFRSGLSATVIKEYRVVL